MELNEFICLGSHFQHFENEIAIVEIDGNKHDKSEIMSRIPLRLDALNIFLICKGKMDLMIDYYAYDLSENTLLDLVERHVVQNVHISSDFKAYNLIVSWTFLSESLGNNRSLPADIIAYKRTRPTELLMPDDVVCLEECIQRLIGYMQQPAHIFQRNLIKNQFAVFMMEIGNIVIHKMREDPAPATLSRRGKIISRFIELLIRHSNEQHEVSFYARELCITPEYLSRILKSFSGKTANKWIDNALMAEAKIMLRNPELTIQQIADNLKFSDQSAFGKFFKKCNGCSPLEYRKVKGIVETREMLT